MQGSQLERLLHATLIHATVLLRSSQPALRAAALRAVRQMLGLRDAGGHSTTSVDPAGTDNPTGGDRAHCDTREDCASGAGLRDADGCRAGESFVGGRVGSDRGADLASAGAMADASACALSEAWERLWASLILGSEAQDAEVRADCLRAAADLHAGHLPPGTGLPPEVTRRLLWGAIALETRSHSHSVSGAPLALDDGGRDASPQDVDACAAAVESAGRLVVAVEGGAEAWATLLRLHAVLRTRDACSLRAVWPRAAEWWVGGSPEAGGAPAAEGLRTEPARGGAVAAPASPPPSWLWCEQLLRRGLSHPGMRRWVAERFLRSLAEMLPQASDGPPVSFVTGVVLPVLAEYGGGSRLVHAVGRSLPQYAVALEQREGREACSAFLDAWTRAMCEAAPRLPAVALSRALSSFAEVSHPSAILSAEALSNLQEAARRFGSAPDWAREAIRDCLLAAVSRLTLPASTSLESAMRLVVALPLCPIAAATPALVGWLGGGHEHTTAPDAWLEAELSAAAAVYLGRRVCEPAALCDALRHAKVDARVLAWSARVGIGNVPGAWERCARLLLAPACDQLSRTRQHAYAHPLEAPLLLLLLAELLACLPPACLPGAAHLASRCEEALAAFATEGWASGSVAVRPQPTSPRPPVACGCVHDAQDWETAREACCAGAAAACVRRLPILARLAAITPSLPPPCGSNCGLAGGGEGRPLDWAGESGVCTGEGGALRVGAGDGDEASSDGSEDDGEAVSSRVQVRLQVASAERIADELVWPLRKQAAGLE